MHFIYCCNANWKIMVLEMYEKNSLSGEIWLKCGMWHIVDRFLRFAISHVYVCVWQHAMCCASGNKSTEIKTGNHYVCSFQLPTPRKKYTKGPVPYSNTGRKSQTAVFKEQINFGQFAMANFGPHSTWHPSSGNQNELPALVSTN